MKFAFDSTNRSTRQILTVAAVVAIIAGGTTVLATKALAQRAPEYQQARDRGQIGEKPDGYLGFVTEPTPAIRALVDDINIKRKRAYTDSAATAGATVEQMAFTSGCNLIAQTAVGERYMAPDGTWQTRTTAAPTRDARCL